MSATPRLDILHHFAAVADPRDGRFTTHLLGDIGELPDLIAVQASRLRRLLRPG